MADESYKISLGVDVDVSDIQSQISTKTKDTKVPIEIEIENLKDIKTQIQNLNKGNKASLDINTVSLEKSLDRVATAIDEIKKSLNTVDGKSGMQSLLSSISQITTALGKAESETDSLVKSLSALSKKDFSLNLGINLGGSNPIKRNTDYGNKVRNETLPQLKKQMNDLVKYYNDTYKSSFNEFEVLQKMVSGTKLNNGDFFQRLLFGKDSIASKMSGSSLSSQMQGYKEYIDVFKQAASLKGLDINSVTSTMSKSADELIKDAQDIQTGAKEMESSLGNLKRVLGGGIDSESLSVTLDPILQDLKAIREAINNLSKGVSIDGLTASFNRLSDVLGKLDANFDKIKDSLGAELAKSISADNAVKTAQQTGQQIGEAISNGIKKNLDIDNAIDKEVLKLMKSQGVVGDKNSQAFKDVRKAFVDYRDEQLGKEIKSDSIYGSYSTASGIDKLTAALANHKRVSDATLESRKQLDDEIKKSNKKAKEGYKIRISDDAVSELGDDFKTLRKSLGNAFTGSGKGTVSFLEYIDQHDINGVIDATKDEAEMIRQLVKMRQSIKNESKGIFTDSDLIDRREISVDDVRLDATAALEAIENAEQKIAQSSTQSANTIVQNQQRIKQSYEDTLAKQKQRLTEIDKEIGDYNERIIDPNVSFDDGQKYMAKMDTLEQEKAEILANIEKIDSAFKKNENILNSFKQSLSNIGMGADEIDAVANKISNLCVQIETLNQKKSARTINTKDGVVEKEVLDVDISGVDEYGNAIKFTQQYDMATADLIKSIEKVSTVQQKAGKSTDTFVKQQKKAVADLTSDINELNRKTIDQNEPKPIKDSSHLDSLKVQYDTITKAIEKMGRASNDNDFQEERNNVNALISEYRSLAREYKNAETVATSLRSKDIDTVKSTYDSKLDVLISKMRKDGVYTSGFEKGAENLRSVLSSSTDASGLVRFLNGLDKLDAGYKRASASAKEFNQAQKVGINVSGLESKIADLQRISPEIDKFETEIDGAKVSVQSLLKDLGQVKTQGDFSVVNSRFKAFTDSAKAAGIAVTEVARKMKSVDDIKLDMELGTYDNQLSQMYDKLDRLSGASKDLREGVEQVENAYREMNNALKGTGDEVADRERLVQAEKEYAAALEKTNNLIKIQSRAEAKDARKDKLENDIKLFQADIDRWLVNNSAATKKFGSQMLDLRAKAEGVDRVTLNGLIGQFKLLDKQADKAGLKMMSVTDKIKSKAKEYMAYFSVAEIFMEVTQAMKRMFDTVVEIDTAMTGLYRVTDLTSAQYDTLFDNMISSAKEYGATLNDIINATTDWVRAGFDADTALGLAEVTTMYQHISDLDYDTAAENLITAYNGFKDELNGAFDGDQVAAVNYIADIFNELDRHNCP